jgi:hypothetical protein
MTRHWRILGIGVFNPIIFNFFVISYGQPYECDICGQKFPRSSSMTRHRHIQCYFFSMTRHRRSSTHVISYVSAIPVRHLRAEIPREQQHDAALAHSVVLLILL